MTDKNVIKIKEFDLIRIHHCDDPSCDMGQIQFECPSCNVENITCDGWYETEDYKDAELVCENCNYKFKIEYNNNEYGWLIKGNAND